MRLIVLHTNDLHGQVEALARISSLAAQVRREAAAQGHATLLCDAGDAEDRTLLECDISKGRAVMTLLDAAGYDLVALGNAVVMSYGPQAAAGLARAATFPILACNLFYPDAATLVAGVRPSVLLSVGGLALGVVGVTAASELYRLFGAFTPDPRPLVAREVASLRARGARFVAVLSHLGTEGGARLAEAVPGIDLIVSGHDHQALEEPLAVGETWIVSAGDRGRYLGWVSLEVDARSGEVERREARLLPVPEEMPGDPQVLRALAGERARLERLLSAPVGRLAQDLDHASDRECGMGDLLADVLRERLGTEIGIVASGALAGGLRSGPVTLGDLWRVSASPGNPAHVALTGEQVLTLLGRGLEPEVYGRAPRPLRGQKLGIPQVSGLRYHWRPGARGAERLAGVWVAGEPLELARTYSVAATDVELCEPFGYAGLPYEGVTFEVPTILREALQEHFARHGTVQVAVGNRIIAED